MSPRRPALAEPEAEAEVALQVVQEGCAGGSALSHRPAAPVVLIEETELRAK